MESETWITMNLYISWFQSYKKKNFLEKNKKIGLLTSYIQAQGYHNRVEGIFDNVIIAL